MRLRPRRRLSASATSRDCAPSCRLRSSRRRSASPASTSRSRDARSSRRLARSSASSRWFSSSSAVAAPAARTVCRSSASARSCTIAAMRRPSRSTSVAARPASPVAGSVTERPVLVDVAVLLGHPEREAQRRVSERGGQRAAQIAAPRQVRRAGPRGCARRARWDTSARASPARNANGVAANATNASVLQRRHLRRGVGEDEQQRGRAGADSGARLRRSDGPAARQRTTRIPTTSRHSVITTAEPTREQHLAELLVGLDQQQVLRARARRSRRERRSR